MKILVTGVAGFIGSHLAQKLLERGDEVLGIDNFYSGTKENLEIISKFDKKNRFIFIEADIRDFTKIDEIVKEYKINQIYHLAAVVSVQESINNPLLSNEVNVKGTLNILEVSRLNNIQRVVFSSSAAVYGDEPTLPKNENSITKPISPYGYEKLIGEYYMKLYNELYALETVVLRYFNVYGPRQNAESNYSGVISIFEKKFKNNEIPNIYGNGEQYRDFIHVKDVVTLNIEAMNIPNLPERIFCVGTNVKTSINNIINILNKKYNKSLDPNYLSQRAGDIEKSVCDNSKITEVFKIKKFIDFEEGLDTL
ncbi:GDP-mannose 4,6-dehydratase [Aliarcobacter butzleri]|uniref:GDP-mannose 4,6-dehydratase n=1 Tax=Aliarcobacter butzleri TaxID=28197 RepID=UPI003B215062